MLKGSRRVRVSAGVIESYTNAAAIGVLSPFSSVSFINVQGRRTGGHQHASNPHQVLILLTVKTVTVRSLLEEAEQNRQILELVDTSMVTPFCGYCDDGYGSWTHSLEDSSSGPERS